MPFQSMTTARSHRLAGDNLLARLCREPPVVDPIGDSMIPRSNER
jgi:hypothetical protein